MIDDAALLWRDDVLIALHKPSGALVHNSAWCGGAPERTLLDVASQRLGQRLWPLHRLDRGTSGVVLFVNDGRAVARFQAALAAGHKDYLAVVRGRTLAAQTVVRPLRDERGVAQTAATTVATLATSEVERVSLVQARLWSGRTHQVRRHLAGAHHPVLGDANHGDGRFNRAFFAALPPTIAAPRLLLHAARVRLHHADSGREVIIAAPPDAGLAALLRHLFTATIVDDAAFALVASAWCGPPGRDAIAATAAVLA